MPHLIGVDLGRHRAFCSLADAEGPRLVPQGDRGEDGLWLRWSGAERSERITDRVLRLAGEHQQAATETVHRVVRALFPELAAGAALATIPVVVVPAAFGPACRQSVQAGFALAAIDLPRHHLVDRPIAALAHWLARPQADPRGVVCLIDNDHGQLSLVAADLDRRRLLVSLPLSFSAADPADDVRDRLNDALGRVRRLVSGDSTAGDAPHIEHLDAARQGSGVDRVLVSGTSADHPHLRRLLEAALPGLTAQVIGDETTPVLGALSLHCLDGWTACWPTLTITIDDVPVTHRELRDGGEAHSPDLPLTCATAALPARLRITDGKLRVALVAGTVNAEAIDLPPEFGADARLRIFDDGRLLILGAQGARPVSLRILWPAPCRSVAQVQVQAIGRRPISFWRPTVAEAATDIMSTDGRPHPATVS